MRLCSIVTALVVSATTLSAFAANCEWNNRRELNRDGYSFATSSWVRRESGGDRYYTCVENLQDRVLWYEWFIPGPKQYIPAKATVSSPRFFTTRETRDINGCLEFGNHHAPMKEYFIGPRTSRWPTRKGTVRGAQLPASHRAKALGWWNLSNRC